MHHLEMRLARAGVNWGWRGSRRFGCTPTFRKSLVSEKCFASNSGAGNGCTNFMGTWNFCVLSAGKPPMPIKFLFFGGRGILGLGGGCADFIFMGAGIFLKLAGADATMS